MADINNPVVYEQSTKNIIDQKVQTPGFNYQNWGDEDLLPVRVVIRDNYRIVQNFNCVYCKGQVSIVSALNAHVEHIVPKSLHIDFMFEPKNLCVVCADCNTIKREQETRNEIPDTLNNEAAIRYPRTSGAFKIVHPHFDIWDEHILKLGNYYVDKSPKGAFTITACLLNRRLHRLGWQKEIYSDAEVSDLMTKYLNENDPLRKANFLTELGKLILQN